tara:strand:- start:610 stop:885 length:276 start_codon:yes stop_codon:yes gene_type:complete
MSDKEMVDVAKAMTKIEQEQIFDTFNKNAEYFSANNKHHSKYISKLFEYFNNNFVLLQKFEEEDKNCEECVAMIIKFWSTVIYDIWQKEIV